MTTINRKIPWDILVSTYKIKRESATVHSELVISQASKDSTSLLLLPI